MLTQCSADLFDFAPVEGRRVEAGFDGGTITSDAGALLLGATDRVVGLVGRLAGCFVDARRPDLIEHDVATLIAQRVFGIALGYEDLNDHEHLRHDPAMAVLAGKLAARRSDCEHSSAIGFNSGSGGAASGCPAKAKRSSRWMIRSG